MLDKNEIISVRNRINGSVGYSVQDLGIRREYSAGETKEVTMEELRKLCYQPGGKQIIKKCLVISNPEAIKELLGNVEPEYFYTDKEVRKLLISGTYDQFLDCLDFAPSGVIDLIKSIAVEIKLNDFKKREAILEKTGFNVTKAIEINEESKIEDTQQPAKSARRAAPIVEEKVADPIRKTTPPKYKVTATVE